MARHLDSGHFNNLYWPAGYWQTRPTSQYWPASSTPPGLMGPGFWHDTYWTPIWQLSEQYWQEVLAIAPASLLAGYWHVDYWLNGFWQTPDPATGLQYWQIFGAKSRFSLLVEYLKAAYAEEGEEEDL